MTTGMTPRRAAPIWTVQAASAPWTGPEPTAAKALHPFRERP
jgi:hypothetical protein